MVGNRNIKPPKLGPIRVLQKKGDWGNGNPGLREQRPLAGGTRRVPRLRIGGSHEVGMPGGTSRHPGV